jgi:plastocyanin
MRRLLLLTTMIAAVFAVPALAATKSTTLQDDFFSKGKVTVKKGDTVHWTWKTDEKHTVTALNGKFGSKQTKTGSFRHKFAKAGKFTVYCKIHPTVMRQKIVVR